MSDIVIDIHTGGRGVDFYPCAHMHLVPDGPQRKKMLEGTEAFNTDFCFLYSDIAGTGLLPVEAESQGKIVITTEMGGSENVTAAVHSLTQSGLTNVLNTMGVLKANPHRVKSWGRNPRAGCRPLIGRIIALLRNRECMKTLFPWAMM